MNPRHLAVLLALVLPFGGCASACSQAPKYTDGEATCLAAADARANARVLACGSNVQGECSTDSIIDAQQKEAHECLAKH